MKAITVVFFLLSSCFCSPSFCVKYLSNNKLREVYLLEATADVELFYTVCLTETVHVKESLSYANLKFI